MWQNWISGILGLWVALVMFLDFSTTLTRILLIISGLFIAVFSFRAALFSVSKFFSKNGNTETIPSFSSNPLFEDKKPDEKPAKGN